MTKRDVSDYGLSQRSSSEVSLDATLAACVNELIAVPPNKVVADVHKQLLVHFQPDSKQNFMKTASVRYFLAYDSEQWNQWHTMLSAMKNVASTGMNLLRSMHEVQNMSEAYVKSIDALAASGEKAFPAAQQRAAELKELASGMREVNRRNKDAMGKLSTLVAKVNEYGHNEKDKLKAMHRGFEAREKAAKKAFRKKKKDQDPEALDKFYVKERNLALRQQYQRYKFFVEGHNEWLRDQFGLFGVLRHMIGGVPVPETQDNPMEAVNHAMEENGQFDDEGYIAPCSYSEDSDSISGENPLANRNPQSRQAPSQEAFFNDNFTMQRPENPDETSPPVTPPRRASPSPMLRYRDSAMRANLVDKSVSAMAGPTTQPAEAVRFRDAATVTESHDRHSQEPTEPPARFSRRPSSVAEPNFLPTPAIRRDINDRIASLSMNALNESDDEEEERRPGKGVMFRASNVNAVPTAFIQQPFMASDYGKILLCIHNFHGQTSNQLSLRSGEKVVLIKCGSKGWVFTKHIETQRTGWFPSRYVRILPDVPKPTVIDDGAVRFSEHIPQ